MCVVVIESSLKVLEKVLESPWILKSQKSGYSVNNNNNNSHSSFDFNFFAINPWELYTQGYIKNNNDINNWSVHAFLTKEMQQVMPALT